eukprot:gene5945-5835_t
MAGLRLKVMQGWKSIALSGFAYALTTSAASSTDRMTLPFDYAWRFHKGDVPCN